MVVPKGEQQKAVISEIPNEDWGDIQSNRKGNRKDFEIQHMRIGKTSATATYPKIPVNAEATRPVTGSAGGECGDDIMESFTAEDMGTTQTLKSSESLEGGGWGITKLEEIRSR